MTLLIAVAQPRQQRLATILAGGVHIGRADQPVRSGLNLGEVHIPVFRAQKSWIARDVRVSHHYVSRHLFGLWSKLVGNDGPDRGIQNRAARLAARVNQVRRGAMLADDVVRQGPNRYASVKEARGPLQMFTDLYTGYRGVDRIIVRTGLPLAIPFDLGIEGIDMRRASTEPEEQTGVRLASRRLLGSAKRSRGERARARLQQRSTTPVCILHLGSPTASR